MPKTFMTLEYGGAEKSLADWGFSRPHIRLASQSESDRFTVTLAVAEAGLSAAFIPFDGWVKVRDGRTKSPLTGAFAGGLIVFQGARVVLPKNANPRGDSLTYTFLGPWHDLETTYFQQHRNVWAGGAFNNFRTIYSSEAALFLKILGNGGIQKQDVGAQIREVLQYAVDQGARFTIGTIDPNHNVNTYQIRDSYCSDALNLCLRSCPDVAVFCDYTTTPPTMHFRKRANRPAVTLQIGDGDTHETTNLSAREDLQVPSVSLYFRRENTTTINGDSFSFIEPMDQPPNWQLWPLTATGRERGNLVQTIDLQGVQFAALTASITTSAFNADEAFWRRQHPQFDQRDTAGTFLIPGLTISNVKVLDDVTKLPVNLALFPNELRTGDLAKWMQFGSPSKDVKWVRATVSAEIKYTEFAMINGLKANGVKPHDYATKTFTAPVVLTNAPSGPYESVASALAAEEIPDGMAKAIYDSMAPLDYEGSHTFVEGQCAYSIGMANTLNLAGGDPAWAAMAASIRAIEYQYEEGFVRTTVEVGPPPHLTAGDRVQLFLINRNRPFYFNPASLGSGQSSNGGGKSGTLGEQVPRENTNHGLDQPTYGMVHNDLGGGKSTAIIQDAPNQSFTLGAVRQDSGAVIFDSAHGSVIIRLGDCRGSDGQMHSLAIKQVTVYDNNCQPQGQLFLCSDPFPIS